jgi:hypothetical protein
VQHNARGARHSRRCNESLVQIYVNLAADTSSAGRRVEALMGEEGHMDETIAADESATEH